MLRIRNLKTAQLDVPSLDVANGECVAVMGASGAGKSLLLRAIADLDPNEADVSLDGSLRSAMPAYEWRRRVALLPAESGWWANTVGEHFRPGAPDLSSLEALGLPGDATGWLVARLSSGERHRLALLRALSLEPKALLLDEPTATLDADSTKCVEVALRNLLAAGAMILMTTHDADQAKRLAARTLRVAEGRISEGRGHAHG